MRRRRWDRHRFEPDTLLEVSDRGFELSVLSFERRVGQIVHDDVGVHAMAFNQPFSFRAIDSK